MPIDISSGYKEVKDKINAYKTYREVSDSIKEIKNKQSDFFPEQSETITSTLDNIKKFQDKTFRNVPSSFDEFFSLIGLTRGNGTQTVAFIKNKLIEAAVKIEPEIKEIIKKETLKVLGRDKTQTYSGISEKMFLDNPAITYTDSILIPIKNIDIFSSLKLEKDSILGQIFYEKDTPSVNSQFTQYGGNKFYPFNKELRNRIESEGKSYFFEYGDLYRGKSGQALFDFSYVSKDNEDYISLTLINRANENNISEFLLDY